jgi:hypothetical protein
LNGFGPTFCRPVGGAALSPTCAFNLHDLVVYSHFSGANAMEQFKHGDMFEFLILLPKPQGMVLINTDVDCLGVDAPFDLPLSCMQVGALKALAVRHCITLGRDHRTRETMAPFLKESLEALGMEFLAVFRKLPHYAPRKLRRPAIVQDSLPSPGDILKEVSEHRDVVPNQSDFPPKPLGRPQQEAIISNFCADLSPEQIEEYGCTACGQLTPLKNLVSFDGLNLSCLHTPALT